jgi:NAD(P)-dependent dehydrogenase (short-subunit alcohol dehydrogenase family)
MKELRFDGKTVVITGAGRGIGRGYAKLFASRGARVVVADFGGKMDGSAASQGPADEVVSEIKAAGGEAVGCYASVAEVAGAQSIIDTAVEAFGGVDVLINNAGISDPDHFPETPEKFQRMFGVHLLGTIYVTQAAWPYLKISGKGRVVNTSSEAIFGIHQYVTSYGSAKAGVFGFTRTLAAEALGTGILVNAVAPRASTRMATNEELRKVFSVSEKDANVFPQLPPEMVAPVTVFLAHESNTLNGEFIAAGGGQAQRVLAIATPGIYSAELSPEYVMANLAQLMDTTGATPIEVLSAHNYVQHAVGR